MKKAKETVDINSLPQVSQTVASILLNFKTSEKKYKLIETFYKFPEKELKLISREEIIQYAKDQKIYIDPNEGKKPAKGEQPPEPKPISPAELAKAAKKLIEENSIPFRKKKKELLDNIESLKKQKEEAINYWKLQEEEAEVETKDNKKKPKTEKKDKKDKKVPPKPSTIIIPEIKEYDIEYLVLLYNYPLNKDEFIFMEKENIILNNVREINEVEDTVVETVNEEQKNEKKSAKGKEQAKSNKDAGKMDPQIVKNFTEATSINSEYTCDNVYNNLFDAKIKSDIDSKIRNCYFDKNDFSYRNVNDDKKTYYNVYQEEFINDMKNFKEFLYYYGKWENLHNFQEIGKNCLEFSKEKIDEMMDKNEFEPKDFEHENIGKILNAYLISRKNFEEYEKQLILDKENEKKRKEEEELKAKELEKLKKEEELKAKEQAKKEKKSAKKKDVKETKETSDKDIVQKKEEVKVEDNEIDTANFNELNQLFENFENDVYQDFFYEPPLESKEETISEKQEEIIDKNIDKISEKDKNMGQSITEAGLNANMNIQAEELLAGVDNKKENENNENNENKEDNENDENNENNENNENKEDNENDENNKNNENNENNENIENNKNIENNENNIVIVKNDDEKMNKEEDAEKIIAKEEEKIIENKENSKIINKENSEINDDNIKNRNKNLSEENVQNIQSIDTLQNTDNNQSDLMNQEHFSLETNEIINSSNENNTKNNDYKVLLDDSENQQNVFYRKNLNEEIIGNINKENIISPSLYEDELDISDNLLPYERIIINESDEIMKKSLESKNPENNFYLFSFEKSLNKSRNIPGIVRPDTLIPIEENLRKTIRAKIYSFLPKEISITMYDNYNIIYLFEECMKKEIPEINFDFSNRVYQEHFNNDILIQRISKLLLFSPEIKTFYNQNNDNTLLMIYYRKPTEKIFRKMNKYRYLSKPDFDNWLQYFKPIFQSKKNNNINEINENEEKQNNETVPEKSALAESGINNSTNKNVVINPYIKLMAPLDKNFTDPLYLCPDNLLGNVLEKIKIMYPNDNSIIIKKILENGNFKSIASYIIKNDNIFGIRKNIEENTEFWFKYKNNTDLSISKSNDDIVTNFTFNNGLLLQILSNGDIVQKIFNQKKYRIITSKATVIENNLDDNGNNELTNIYYANGNFSEIKNGFIKTINNKGHQIEKNIETKELKVLENINTTMQTDINSQTSTLIREDGLIKIQYYNKNTLTIHKDTTKIFTEFPDENGNYKYLIEHDDYCTVNVYICGKDKLKYNKDNEIIFDLIQKSKNGILYEILSPDKNLIYVFKNEDEKTNIIIFNDDKSIIKIDPMNNNAVIFKELLTLDEIFVDKNEIKGEYIADFNENKIYIIDNENNKFEIYSDGYANCILNNEDKNDDSKTRPASPDYESLNIKKDKDKDKDKEKEKEKENKEEKDINNNLDDKNLENNNNENVVNDENENEKTDNKTTNDTNNNYINPRLFVIENDNSGYELLNEDQISLYKSIKQNDKNHCKYLSQKLTIDFISHYWVTKYFSTNEGIKESHHIHNIQIPSNVKKFCHLPNETTFSEKEIYFYRNLIERKTNFDSEFRNKVQQAKEESNAYFDLEHLKWYYGTFSFRENPEEEKEKHNKILSNMLNTRQTNDIKFNYEHIRKKINITQDYIELSEKESVLFDIEKDLQEKENKKIKEDLDFRKFLLSFNNKANDKEVSSIVNSPKKNIKENNNQLEVKDNYYYPQYFDSEKGLQYLSEHPHQVYQLPVKQNLRYLDVLNDIKDKEKNTIEQNQNLNSNDIDNNMIKPDNYQISNNNNLISNDNLNNLHFSNDTDLSNKKTSPIIYLSKDISNNYQTPYKIHNNRYNKEHSFNTIGVSKSVKNPSRSLKIRTRKTPSIFCQNKILNRINDEYNKQKAIEWVESKKMKFSVDGKIRKNNPYVPSYIKPTFPQAEFNEDYLYTEKMTEPRIKTSSVSNRVYFNAPSINEIRKSGQHDIIIEAIENRRTPEEMMERLNLMITGELCDPLNKLIKIDPVSLDFGFLCQNKNYQMYIKIRNDDNIINRVMIRTSKNNDDHIFIENFIGGKIVPGETKKVKVVFKTGNDISGKYNDMIEIISKSFIYKIPIKAYIAAEEDYDVKRFGHLKGRMFYSKNYPAADMKHIINPVKLILPKIKEIEEKEKLNEKKISKTTPNNENEDEDDVEKKNEFPRI